MPGPSLKHAGGYDEAAHSQRDGDRLREAGRSDAERCHPQVWTSESARGFHSRHRELQRTLNAALNALHPANSDARWAFENHGLIRAAQGLTNGLGKGLERYPALVDDAGEHVPRVVAVAAKYLEHGGREFNAAQLIAYVAGFQEVQELSLAELWALRPALQAAFLRRLASALCEGTYGCLAALITSLRSIAQLEWKELFEELSLVDRALANDPAGAWTAMDHESRELYRHAVAEIARHSGKSECRIARAAVQMANAPRSERSPGSRATERRRHVGFYLVAEGRKDLCSALGCRPPLRVRFRQFLLDNALDYYLVGIEVVTLMLVYTLLGWLGVLKPVSIPLFLLLLPAMQAAIDFINNLTVIVLPPRALPKLDFSDGVPSDCTTMVAVPALLLNERQVQKLVRDLEIRYLANADPSLIFALLTDCPDSDRQFDESDRLAEYCRNLIREANARYGHSQSALFYLLHRHRVYNPSQARWMGWERKRGKLLDLNRLLRGGFDSFPVKEGDVSILQSVRYVIALDADTQLPPDSARRLIGTIAHPLNRAVVDAEQGIVREGYGILQPRIGISTRSASLSWFAGIFSGQTGFDIYTRAVSDVYQDLFGEGVYAGKGIYEVDAVRATLEQRFPENALLSHDLVEGAFSRAGLVSDIELIDDYPSHFSAWSRRIHRWMRGDWQTMRWLLPRIPNRHHRHVANPINLISRWKILDNLRRSVLQPAILVLLVFGWFYRNGEPVRWTEASLMLLLLPSWSAFLLAMPRAPRNWPAFRAWITETAAALFREHAIVLLHLIFLLTETLLAIDAIVRSLTRLLLTKRLLLEWETAAEAETAVRGSSVADRYLRWSGVVAVGIGLAVWFLRPSALPVAGPFVALWIAAPLIAMWLDRPIRSGRFQVTPRDIDLLRASALRTWRYFREGSNEQTNWLIPDNIAEDGTVDPRLSPTNLGLLLNTRIAALHFGYLSVPEFIEETKKTLQTMLRLPRFHGHFLNWYATDTLHPLSPRFVSSVDSGNLAACLWTLKQAACTFPRGVDPDEALWHGICDIARLIGVEGGREGRALRDRILQCRRNWKRHLPELEAACRAFSEARAPDVSWWAGELVVRFEKAQEWLDRPFTDELKRELGGIATTADALVSVMDFGFLFDGRRKLLSIGYNVEADRLEHACYDLLASEARIATFIAIAKGDIPHGTWLRLDRSHTTCAGARALLSWTGTMFEYLMPSIWMRHPPGSLVHRSMCAVVTAQRHYVRSHAIPWGVSESGYAGGYMAFGVPELAIKQDEGDTLVISPYSTFLAMLVAPRHAIKNVHRLARRGWLGRYGFYEAVDYSNGQANVMRYFMAHHQGMSLLSACNVLYRYPLQRVFHAELRVAAMEPLLNERLPAAIVAEARPCRPRASVR